MTPYDKTHHSYDQQLDKLIKRGMRVNNRADALYALQHINYYRLGLYWHRYEVKNKAHRFIPDTQFETILTLYNFDKKLRQLVLEALEHIEVSVRANWAYQMSATHGTHAHLIEEIHNRSTGNKRNVWQDNLEKMKH
ncbi:MAG: Abi family protein, partial [Alphaproteobacteria bacterium]|nr:Abi family protein [Alphaproteobacteria bacterium]